MASATRSDAGWHATGALLYVVSIVSLLTGQRAVAEGIVPGAAWREMVQAAGSAQVVLEQGPDNGEGASLPFVGEVMRGGQKARRIDVRIEGWRDLWLMVDDVDDYSHDVANWADARLLSAEGSVTYLDELEPMSVRQGWGQFRRGSSAIDQPLRIGDRTFERGLGTHAVSVIHYRLDAPYERFESWVGVDSSRPERQGSIRFLVSPTAIAHRTAAPMASLLTCQAALAAFDFEALRLAVTDLTQRFTTRYPNGQAYLTRLEKLQRTVRHAAEAESKPLTRQAQRRAIELIVELESLRRQALLANPLLDFDRILLLQRGLLQPHTARSVMGAGIGMPANWQAGVVLPRRNRWNDRLAVLSDLRESPQVKPLFIPEGGRTLTDPVLEFDGHSILFAMEGMEQANWRIFEIASDGSGLRQVTPDDGADVGHFDPCYLADGDVLFTSTAGFMGLPCVFGNAPMVCLYRLDRRTGAVRQLTFEQDSNWNPTPLANGRVLYQRWEYSDIPHSNSRILFHMNPDGTDQREYYGSGSYFPPSFFYARPVPDHPRKVIGVATGHHGTHRSGRLLLVDPALGRQEAAGVIQEIPGRGKKVEPIVRDRLVDGVWPQFLHPYPLCSKYYLVAAKPTPDALWGIYLVDVFDNVLLIHEMEGQALLWPIPMRKTPRPPVLQDRVDLSRPDGTMLITDIYRGGGLAGIPRGTVGALRIFEYYFSYRDVGGLLGSIGLDGPWDIKRVLGTVPVESDGSAYFTVPANTPISIQALDKQGQALQLMRSWTVAMPGESVSCIGCHETQNEAAPPTLPAAARRAPSEIDGGWAAPVRGFNFEREVQPVLDRHCGGCHDGSPRQDGREIPYLKGVRHVTDYCSDIAGSTNPGLLAEGEGFSESYVQLHRYVRRPGIEGDLRMLSPMDYHFSATELGQMLRKGHHGVRLDSQSWERLVTWFDLNAPYHGTWGEIVGDQRADHLRRMQERAHELRATYASQGPITDYEDIPESPPFDRTFVSPSNAETERTSMPEVEGWPFNASEARRRQAAASKAAGLRDGFGKTIGLGEGPPFGPVYLGYDDNRQAVNVGPVRLELVLIPGGRFVIGSTDGHADEGPPTAVEVAPFWMARYEITNAQYRLFKPRHESRDESRHGYQFGRRGFFQDAPHQPAVRVSWREARAFCQWLSEKTGMSFDLPTEAQWEWAARAGGDTDFHFGDVNSDYSRYANLADRALRAFAQCTSKGDYSRAEPIANPNRYDDWIPRCDRFDDGGLVTAEVGRYGPNPWGLYDMHGNAAEWTRSAYLPYPYREDDGRNDSTRTDVERVARGGSWRDRPHQATASYRRPYQPYHRVFNVGFRIVAPVNPSQ